MVTVRLPWVTAAAVTVTLLPITTVPVRELTTTLAGASPGLSSMFSTSDMKDTRWVGSAGANTRTEEASSAVADWPPRVLSMACAIRVAVVKSWRCKFKVR